MAGVLTDEAIRRGIIAETTKERRKFIKEKIAERISRYKHGNSTDLAYRKEITDPFVSSDFVYGSKPARTCNFRDGTGTLALQETEAFLSSN